MYLSLNCKRIIAFSGVCLSFIFFWGCGERAKNDIDKKIEKKKVRWVKVSHTKPLPVRRSVEYVGVLLAYQKIKVDSEIGGTIEKLYFEKGDKVQKGRLLANVSTTSIGLEVRRANSLLEEAKAARLEAENNYKRISNLHKIQAVADSRFDSAKRAAHMARANVAAAEAALALVEDRLRKSKLYAPVAGITAFREVEAGEVIPPGMTITQIVNLDRLKIRVSLHEKDIRTLEQHKHFTFTIDAIPGEVFSAQLIFISPTADPITRSFPVELMVEKPDQRMADGMTVRIKLPLINEKKTIKVPSSWLSEENGKIGLFVAEDGKAVFKAVKLGDYYDQRVEILSGLGDQQQVISNPSGLKSGDKVKYELGD